MLTALENALVYHPVHHTEDWDLWLRLAQAELPVVCDELHVASLEHSQRSVLGGNWNVVREAERLLAKHGPLAPVGRALVAAFDLNHPRRVLIREAEEHFDLFPP